MTTTFGTDVLGPWLALVNTQTAAKEHLDAVRAMHVDVCQQNVCGEAADEAVEAAAAIRMKAYRAWQHANHALLDFYG